MSECLANGCGRLGRYIGYCGKHYLQIRTWGKIYKSKYDQTPEERFLEKCLPEPMSGCWIWEGGCLYNGYGVFHKNNRSTGAHRFSYENFIGPIPEGFQLDHLCKNPSCVNPNHLEPVTPKENTRRGNTGKHELDKTHCPRGHPYSGNNLMINSKGYRECKTCRNYNKRELRKKRSRKFSNDIAEV